MLNVTNVQFNSIPVKMGKRVNFYLYGGPYMSCRDPNMVKINLALENGMPCDYGIHIPDFGVPTDMNHFEAVVMRALHHGLSGEGVFVGCGAGMGRTGTFMSCIAKTMFDYKKRVHLRGRGDDPIRYVRVNYNHGAVETGKQAQFVYNFDTTRLVDWYQASRELYDNLKT